MMGFELDHIGIATESLDAVKTFYEAMGLKLDHVEEVKSEKVKVGFFALNNRCNIELLEPTSDSGTVAKFLEKRGPGIHHICLRVGNIRETIKRLVNGGVTMIHTEPFKGAHNCEVAFIHPKSTGGVLIELSQPNA
ncbi:MAG: methylmalonyl-CoA epimerase [Proteobacteria bacterium SG_bin7]|nr:MAG: methylmalonyl-CoA epimerase [Proteobacteria bacterium SG_bin7]